MKNCFLRIIRHCYGNPAYAEEKLGEYGQGILHFLYAELRGGTIAYAYEKKIVGLYMCTAELFLEVFMLLSENE